MKKIINKSLVALMTLLTVVGCGDNSNSSSNSSGSSSVVLTENQKLEKMVNDARKGVKFVGTVHQTSNILDGDHGTPTGEVMENVYNSSFTYQSGKENAFSSYVYSKEEDGTETVYFNNKVFQGEDGYAYYYELNYDNTVTAFPFYDYGEKVNFAYYCLNPFSYFEAEDFIKVKDKDNTYTLSRENASLFSSNVFGDIDTAFFGVVKSIEFVLDGSKLKSFTLIPEDNYGMQIDFSTGGEIYYFLEQVATFNVEDVGYAMVAKPKVREVTENRTELDALQAAFSKYAGKNYTANMKIEYTGDRAGETSFATYYYTGEHLYYSRQEDQSKPNAENDILLYDNGGDYLVPYGYSDALSGTRATFTQDDASSFKGFSTSYTKYTYDDVNPEISKVSADLFDYNKTFKNYSVCDDIVSNFAHKAIVPQLNVLSGYLDGYGNSFKIKLTSSGDIDYISFSVSYSDYFESISANIRLTFTNVGTTVLPHNLVLA